MTFSRKLLKIANSLVSFVVLLALFIFGSYAAYALWDNQQVYSAVTDAKADMLKLKPETSSEKSGPGFDELIKINPDVCAWLTLDGTEIDYPVVQGTDNLQYINTDVYGNFSLAGSIFLDTRSSRDFSDTYSLLYGHHMANHLMFGDLDLYKDAAFFDENTTGTLILPGGVYDIEIFACLLAKSTDSILFNPTRWRADNIQQMLDYASASVLHARTSVVDALKEADGVRILAMSTCSSEHADARTIILAAITPASGSDT